MNGWIDYLIIACISIVAVPITTLITLWVNKKFNTGKMKYCYIFKFDIWDGKKREFLKKQILENLLPNWEKNEIFFKDSILPKINIKKEQFDLMRFNQANDGIEERKIDKYFVIIIQKTIANEFNCFVIKKKEWLNKKWLQKYGKLIVNNETSKG